MLSTKDSSDWKPLVSITVGCSSMAPSMRPTYGKIHGSCCITVAIAFREQPSKAAARMLGYAHWEAANGLGAC